MISLYHSSRWFIARRTVTPHLGHIPLGSRISIPIEVHRLQRKVCHCWKLLDCLMIVFSLMRTRSSISVNVSACWDSSSFANQIFMKITVPYNNTLQRTCGNRSNGTGGESRSRIRERILYHTGSQLSSSDNESFFRFAYAFTRFGGRSSIFSQVSSASE